MKEKDERWSLFWCDLLHPLIYEDIDKSEINKWLKNLSQKEHLFPDGQVKRASLSTLRRKLKIIRQNGIKGLSRKIRIDKGKPRAASPTVIAKAVELKKEQPLRSDNTINHFLKEEYGQTIPKSTLYRHLKLAGATRIKLGVSKLKVRKRWTKDHTHDLWVGDFEEGPYVLHEDQVVPTYLSLFIDCHSRYVVEGRYYLNQQLNVLIDSLLRAWSIHGTCNALYLDNAKIYVSNALKRACYSLHIKLLHRPPGDAAPGGLVERMFKTIQNQFESEVRAGEILSLNELNKGFTAYLEIDYHPKIHTETNQSPQNRYESGIGVLRHVNINDLTEFFMKEEKRTVDKVFSDIRFGSKFYRVDKRLRGDRVKIKYDPYSKMEKIWVYSLNEEYLCQGVLHNRETADNSGISEKTTISNNYIKLLTQKHEKWLDEKSSGIDFRNVTTQRIWPFNSFIKTLGKLMGRKGELTAFNSEELELLKKTYNRHKNLDEKMVKTAWVRSDKKTIAHFKHQLQLISIKQKEDKNV